MNKGLQERAASMEVSALVNRLKTSLTKGLSANQAAMRLQKYGPNTVVEKTKWWWSTLWDQFQSPFIYLLLLICGLMVFLGDTTNALITLAIVALNTLVGFYQEYKASQALQALQRLMVLQSTVIREGLEVNVASTTLVLGDIMVLYPGDIVPADARITWQEQLLMNESSLTGESVPVSKTAAPITDTSQVQYSRASNMVFSGTTVLSGKARALVVATGVGTSFGEIARLVTEEVPPSPFAQGIAGISRFMVYLTIGTIAVLVLAHILLRSGTINIFELLMFVAALGVSVIPEALPVVTTFCLSRGAALLAKHNVVVKRLSAIEDLGSMQILCTDKTGTLTENKMAVVAVYGAREEVLWYAALGSGLSHYAAATIKGFDAAIFQALDELHRQRLAQYTKVHEVPFDPERRRSMVTMHGPDAIEVVVRGAPETVIARSIISDAHKEELDRWMSEQGIQGRRVLAIARHPTSKGDAPMQEEQLTIVGLIAFEDPLKQTAQEAVEKAKQLHVGIKVLSGDSAAVCGAVGMQVGILQSPAQVMEGAIFQELDYEGKKKAVQEYSVFARVTPVQKYEIIKLLQERFQVGYMGDGINDAPALRIAHVAMAVDDAADIARQSADIILLHRSLRVIVDGISYGRQTFANTMKFLKITLAGNVGNFYAIGIASLCIDSMPMLPTQLLLLNFLSDIPLIALSTDAVDLDEIAYPRRYNIRDIAVITLILGITSTLFDFLIFAWFFRLPPAVLQTNWFIASIWTELVFIFSIRTRGFMLTSSPPSFTLLALAGIIAVISLILPYSSIGHTYFHFVTPQLHHLMVMGGVVIGYLAITEIIKLLYYRMYKAK